MPSSSLLPSHHEVVSLSAMQPRLVVSVPIHSPTGKCRSFHLWRCPVAVGLSEQLDHSEETEFCLGCFLNDCMSCKRPFRFLLSQARCLLRVVEACVAYKEALTGCKPVWAQLVLCVSKLVGDRTGDELLKLLCELLALLMSVREKSDEEIWSQLPREAVVLTLWHVLNTDLMTSYISSLTQTDNQLLGKCVEVVAQSDGGNEVAGSAACEVIECVTTHLLERQEVAPSALWFVDVSLCRGLVSRFARGKRCDCAIRVLLMIAGCQEAVDALFMGSLAQEDDIGVFQSFIHELEAAIEYHVLQSAEEDLQEACIMLCRVFLVPAPPLVVSGPRTLSITDWLLDLVRTGSSMGAAAAVCLQDFAEACPEGIASRIWSADFVSIIQPSVHEVPFADLLVTLLKSVPDSNAKNSSRNCIKAMLASAEILLCSTLPDHAIALIDFVIPFLTHEELPNIEGEIISLLKSTSDWATAVVESDMAFTKICDLIVAAAPSSSPSVPPVAVIEQLSSVFLIHFISSPVAMEGFLRAMSILIGDFYASSRLRSLQHRLRSAAILAPALSTGAGPVVRLLLLGVLPRWLITKISFEDLRGNTGELFRTALRLDGPSSIIPLTVLFTSLTNGSCLGSSLLTSVDPLSGLVVSDWEPRLLIEGLIVASHTFRLISSQGNHRMLSHVKHRLLAYFGRAHCCDWVCDREASVHDLRELTLTLAWLLEDCEEVQPEIMELLAVIASTSTNVQETGFAELVRAVLGAASQQVDFCTLRILQSTMRLLPVIKAPLDDWEVEALLSACQRSLSSPHPKGAECALLCEIAAVVVMSQQVKASSLSELGNSLESLAAAQITSSVRPDQSLTRSCLKLAAVVFELLRSHNIPYKCVWLCACAESSAEHLPESVAFSGVAGVSLVPSSFKVKFSIRAAYCAIGISTGLLKPTKTETSSFIVEAVERAILAESALDVDSALATLVVSLVFIRSARDNLAFSLLFGYLPYLSSNGFPYLCLLLALARYRPVWYRFKPNHFLRLFGTIGVHLEEQPSHYRNSLNEGFTKWASDLLPPKQLANSIARVAPAKPKDSSKVDWETWIVTEMTSRACELAINKLC